ncbi:MAG: redox-sensing transcriptional repressor Rex [Lachnospirales bacterium]
MDKEKNKNISLTVIKRLPKYYRYLGELLDVDVSRISSKELSERLNITASQIRQDLNNFGSFGLQGYGYNVELLYEEIGRILGLNKKHNIIIIGAGNIGRALLNYSDFNNRGFKFIGVFDKSPELIGTKINNITIQGVDEIEDFINSNNVDIAVLTVPKSSANYITKILYKNEIRGIWNISHVDLRTREFTKVEEVHLMDCLMTLSYKIN